MERCNYCGTKLIEMGDGKKLCPNHGIMEDNQKEIKEKKIPSYIS
mgnify:CR=1 FL=1